MPTFIKTGFWDKKAKAPDGWLDLNLFVQTLIPPTPSGDNIYNNDGTLTNNRTLFGNSKSLQFDQLFNFIITTNKIAFGIEEGAQSITTMFESRIWGIWLDFFSREYRLGEYNGPGTTHILVKGDTDTITASNGNNDKGIKLNFFNNSYEFGRITGGNATTFKIDDGAAFPIQVSGTNVTQNTGGATSGKFLKIKVGGVDYLIELKNPS